MCQGLARSGFQSAGQRFEPGAVVNQCFNYFVGSHLDLFCNPVNRDRAVTDQARQHVGHTHILPRQLHRGNFQFFSSTRVFIFSCLQFSVPPTTKPATAAPSRRSVTDCLLLSTSAGCMIPPSRHRLPAYRPRPATYLAVSPSTLAVSQSTACCSRPQPAA